LRSRSSIAIFLLLNRQNVLTWVGRRSVFAPKSLWASFAAFVGQHLWLGPGLLLAAILLLLLLPRSSTRFPEHKPVHRVFRKPNLARFHDITPRHHQDLEA
jgi:hypothetical protein